jgi:hypothetical protein
MYVKVEKNLKGRGKAKVWLLRIEMVVTDDFMVIHLTKLRVNRVYVLKLMYVLFNLTEHHLGLTRVITVW